MGTRGLYGFRKLGHDKLTYNHFDSYPECLGRNILEFCASHSYEQMHEFYWQIQLVSEDTKPNDWQIQWAKNNRVFVRDVGSQTETDWYCLLRNLQGDLELAYKLSQEKSGVVYQIDNHDFIRDSLFCEYAYIINLDTRKLEFYIGFQKTPQEGNRYGTKPDEEGYYPCRLVAEFPLKNLDVNKAVAEMVKVEKEEI